MASKIPGTNDCMLDHVCCSLFPFLNSKTIMCTCNHKNLFSIHPHSYLSICLMVRPRLVVPRGCGGQITYSSSTSSSSFSRIPECMTASWKIKDYICIALCWSYWSLKGLDRTSHSHPFTRIRTVLLFPTPFLAHSYAIRRAVKGNSSFLPKETSTCRLGE